MKKKIALFLLILLLIGSIYGLYRYIEFNKNYASSNAVFIKSDSLTFLSFKLPGKIEKIYVKEGDEVKKGELLAKLDTKDLELQKKAVIFKSDALKNKINSFEFQKEKIKKEIDLNSNLTQNEISKLKKAIEAKNHEINAKKIKLNKLKSDYLKFKRLFLQGKIAKEKYENVKTAYLMLSEEIKADNNLLEGMKEDLKNLKIKIDLIKNNLLEVKRLEKSISALKKELKALLEKKALLEQNINDSFLYAPFNAKIAKKFINENEVVGAGVRVLSLVNLNDIYVLNLLEETKLKGIAPGCYAKIHVDALDKDFDGYVEKILPASAATFALVPRDISSGEFTKLAQRFYVRIKFKKIPKNVLVGMSAEVVIKRCKK